MALGIRCGGLLGVMAVALVEAPALCVASPLALGCGWWGWRLLFLVVSCWRREEVCDGVLVRSGGIGRWVRIVDGVKEGALEHVFDRAGGEDGGEVQSESGD